MARVLHHRLYGLPEHRLERVHEQFDALAGVRAWRCGRLWVAISQSRGLFEREYFRHLKKEVGPRLSAAGFVKMAGVETDALMMTSVRRQLSVEYGISASILVDDHTLAKL